MKKATVFFLALACLMISSTAFASDGGEMSFKGYVALAAGLSIGLGALGGALGQAKAATAALEGIARNPSASGQIFTPMIIALALIESLVIYALLIAFMLQGKI